MNKVKKIEELHTDDRLYQLSGKTGNDEIDIVDKLNELVKTVNLLSEAKK